MSIPASVIANCIPGVLSPGGNALVMNGLVLTQSTMVPAGTVQSFASAASVGSFFGLDSAEYAYATIYFAGMVNSTQLPSSILFARYNATSAAATLRSGSFANYTLAEMQALTGVLTITVDGTVYTSSSISLTGVASQSLMATAIAAAFTGAEKPTVTWDSVHSQFVFSSTTTGNESTISYASGTLAQSLLVTQAAGGVLSQGADVDTPSSCMNNIVAVNQNWATMSYITEPSLSNKELFAEWFSTQNFQYLAVMWDSDTQACVQGATEPFGVVALANKYNGVMCIGGDPAAGTLETICKNVAAFVQGMVASINYNQTNGRINLAGKSANASAVIPTCSNLQTYENLLANGYNCYGAFASRNQGFNFFSNGNLPGKYPWADQLVNEIWLSAQFQLALIQLYTTVNDIPYDPPGYGLIRAALVGQSNANSSNNGPINTALNNGVIQPGVSLSSAQAAEVNAAAGVNCSGIIQNNGWYLQILDPGAIARNARQTPIINFWYTDGGGVNSFSMSSVDIL